MVRIRGEEVWAHRCIRSVLGRRVQVIQHDDGSLPGMYDLEIVHPNRRRGAVEVTAAADRRSIELWKLVNGHGRRVEPDLVGGWMVALSPWARANALHTELPGLLRQLEAAGLRLVRPDPWSEGPFDGATRALGISHLAQGDTDYPGSIYFTLDSETSGGMVPDTGDVLAQWLGDWLHQPEQAHNLEKLARSGAEERHMFVILPGLTVAPFGVVDLLMRDDPPLPKVAPALPSEVTHVWAMSTWNSGTGMRWSPASGWQHFDKLTALREDRSGRSD